MASAGNGTPQHLSPELFMMMTGTSMIHSALSRRRPPLCRTNSVNSFKLMADCSVTGNPSANSRWPE